MGGEKGHGHGGMELLMIDDDARGSGA